MKICLLNGISQRQFNQALNIFSINYFNFTYENRRSIKHPIMIIVKFYPPDESPLPGLQFSCTIDTGEQPEIQFDHIPLGACIFPVIQPILVNSKFMGKVVNQKPVKINAIDSTFIKYDGMCVSLFIFPRTGFII